MIDYDLEVGAAVEKHIKSYPDSASKEYIKRIFSKPIKTYTERLLQYGFTGKDLILDAGCGYGQWSLALAQLNSGIRACDPDPERVAFLGEVSQILKLKNFEVTQQSITKLSYPDECFDGIFCYLVLSVTPWKETLRELRRVLKKNGILYVNAYGLGWMTYLWKSRHNQTPQYDPRKVVSICFNNTWRYSELGEPQTEGDIMIEPDELLIELEQIGFSKIEIAAEGCLRSKNLDESKKAAFFPGEINNQAAVFEAIAIK